MEIITSDLFKRFPNIRFGISTRRGGVSPSPFDLNLSISVGDDPENVQKNRELFFSQLSIPQDSLAFPLQCHTSHVQSVSTPGKYSETDGLATRQKGIYLVVTVADCVPIFIYDPEHEVVAGVHAGWKGSAAGITRNMIKLMRDKWISHPSELLVYIGPAAGVCCYEVGEEVARLFPKEYSTQRAGNSFGLNLREINGDQLVQQGVSPAHIEFLDECTICNPERYHSYRRDGKQSGRMMGVIGMVP